MKRRIFLITIATIALATSASAAPPTMRVDYYHTGNATEERFSLDRNLDALIAVYEELVTSRRTATPVRS